MLSSSRNEFDRTAEVAATARCRMLRVDDQGDDWRDDGDDDLDKPVSILGSRAEPLEMLHKDKDL